MHFDLHLMRSKSHKLNAEREQVNTAIEVKQAKLSGKTVNIDEVRYKGKTDKGKRSCEMKMGSNGRGHRYASQMCTYAIYAHGYESKSRRR